jgi:hypothetical protein
MEDIKTLFNDFKVDFTKDKEELKSYVHVATESANKIAKLEDFKQDMSIKFEHCCNRVDALEKSNADRISFNRWAIPTVVSIVSLMIVAMTFLLVQVVPRVQHNSAAISQGR